ncbi:MAG: hypothetical protein ACREFJ_01655, partial [Acetobacteraceae bacterium]
PLKSRNPGPKVLSLTRTSALQRTRQYLEVTYLFIAKPFRVSLSRYEISSTRFTVAIRRVFFCSGRPMQTAASRTSAAPKNRLCPTLRLLTGSSG